MDGRDRTAVASADEETVSTSPFRKVGKGENRLEPIWISEEGFSRSHFVLPKHYQEDVERILLPRGMIGDRIEKLACDIKRSFESTELHLVCLLKGSRGFFGQLLSCLNKIHMYSSDSRNPPYMEHYVRLKSYTDASSSGSLQVLSDDLSCLGGKQVLIVEDIIDTGHTLTKFCKWLEKLKPANIAVASLLEKRTDKSNGFKGDFVGFSVPDCFVVGFSLDYNEFFRDLEHICKLSSDAQHRYRQTEANGNCSSSNTLYCVTLGDEAA